MGKLLYLLALTVGARRILELGNIRVGPARDTLRDVEGPFDLVFIDADKASMPEYFAATLPMVRPGGLIIGDNTVRGGSVLDPGEDESAAGARGFYAAVAAADGVEATAIQTVGVKGYDGFVLARKRHT